MKISLPCRRWSGRVPKFRAMEPKYKVRTYRGWEYALNYPEAIRIAYSRAVQMREEMPNNPENWWAKIDYTYCIEKTRACAIANEQRKVKINKYEDGKDNK